MESLHIYLFGKFCVKCGSKIVSGLESGKIQELICYLALYQDRLHSRDMLATLLWGESESAQSKRYLSKALWQIQTALYEEAQVEHGRLLLTDPQAIQLVSTPDLWLDIAVFEQAYGLCRANQNRAALSGNLEQFEEAINLYQGDLLEGCFQPWCLYERERLRLMLMLMLDRMIDYFETNRSYDEALVFCTRMLQFDTI